MRLIIGQRQSGRTTKLLELAARYQRENDKHVCVIIAHNMDMAEWLSKGVMRRHVELWFESNGQRGLDPSRTIIEHANGFGMRNRGRSWSNDLGEVRPHHVFAFVDDVDLLRPGAWDQLNQELTMHGVAVAAVTIEVK